MMTHGYIKHTTEVVASIIYSVSMSMTPGGATPQTNSSSISVQSNTPSPFLPPYLISLVSTQNFLKFGFFQSSIKTCKKSYWQSKTLTSRTSMKSRRLAYLFTRTITRHTDYRSYLPASTTRLNINLQHLTRSHTC